MEMNLFFWPCYGLNIIRVVCNSSGSTNPEKPTLDLNYSKLQLTLSSPFWGVFSEKRISPLGSVVSHYCCVSWKSLSNNQQSQKQSVSTAVHVSELALLSAFPFCSPLSAAQLLGAPSFRDDHESWKLIMLSHLKSPCPGLDRRVCDCRSVKPA